MSVPNMCIPPGKRKIFLNKSIMVKITHRDNYYGDSCFRKRLPHKYSGCSYDLPKGMNSDKKKRRHVGLFP
jgi:hypothetical protein